MSTESDMVAIDGRRLGQRAQLTRRRLLDATADLLDNRGILELKVVEVAREVGTSPATFYQYFQNVEEAVLTLAEEAGEELRDLVPLVDEPWRGAKSLVTARALVDGFVSYWDRNRAVLRSRNLAAQEGDTRFRELRIRSLSQITDRLERRVAENRSAGRVASAVTPYAAAAALVAMMERMAAFHYEFEARGVGRDDMVETVARMVFQTVTGRSS